MMFRFLQSIFIFSLLFSQLNIFAQNERVKISKTEQIPAVERVVSGNKNTVKLNAENNQVFNKNQLQNRLTDSTLSNEISNEDFKYKNNNPSDDRIFLSDTVTYFKEIDPLNEKTVLSEKKANKVVPSVNYKPRVVKEDINPVLNYSSADISSEKRVYLQQEAADLQREIDLNKGNTDFDLAFKTKKLDEIKKMLQ